MSKTFYTVQSILDDLSPELAEEFRESSNIRKEASKSLPLSVKTHGGLAVKMCKESDMYRHPNGDAMSFDDCKLSDVLTREENNALKARD